MKRSQRQCRTFRGCLRDAGRLLLRGEFSPVPSLNSVFVYTMPPKYVMLGRLIPTGRAHFDAATRANLRRCESCPGVTYTPLRDPTLLDLPHFKTKCGQTSFKFSAASAWNKLPKHTREFTTLAHFKDKTFTYLIGLLKSVIINLAQLLIDWARYRFIIDWYDL